MTLSSSPGTDDMSLCVWEENSSVSFVCGGGEKREEGAKHLCVENPPRTREPQTDETVAGTNGG